MGYILRINGNFLVVSDSSTGEEYIRSNRSNTTFSVDTSDVVSFYFDSPVKSSFPVGQTAFNFAFADIVDYRTGSAFASITALKDYLSESLLAVLVVPDLPSKAGNALKYLQVDAAETGVQWTAVSASNLGNSDLTSTSNARVFNLNGNTTSNYLQFKNSGGTSVFKIAGDGGSQFTGRIGLNTAVNSIIDFYMAASAGTYYGHYATGTYLQAAFAAPVNTSTTPTNFYAPACGNSAAYKAENTGGTATVTGARRGFVADNFNNSAYNNVAFSADIANSGGGEALAFDCVNGNFKFGTGTGTKIGTATGQKIGFWNATPIVQPTTAIAAATLTGGGGATVTDTDTFDGYTLKQIVKALRNSGLLA